MSEPIFMFDAQDPAMEQACQKARESFRYFWRELSWEARRIVPALDMSMVKLPFTDGPRTDGNPAYEHMWISDIGFDGDYITGTLLNSPNWLTSVKEGNVVSVPFFHLTDWMMTCNGRAYGGFTVNLMRSQMERKARAQHDAAWGLDFGAPEDVQVELQQEPQRKGFISRLFSGGAKAGVLPENFSDRPMCINMIPKIRAQLESDPSIANTVDPDGWSILHHEAMAGNLGLVQLLIEFGADRSARTPNGYTSADLARKIGWAEVADFIDS